MRKIVVLSLLIAIFVVMTGMGLKQESKIPVPAKRYNAIIIDQADVRTNVSNISVEGNTYFSSRHGRGTLFIDFKDIQQISFTPSLDRDVSVTIQLKNDESMDGLINGNNFLFGIAPFGNFKVKVREIKRIDFQGEVPDSSTDSDPMKQK